MISMVRVGPETTRAELLYAAALEIAERGYSGASFSAVAARLGLTKGAFAYHFPTKQALAVGLMDEFGKAFTAAVEQARQDFPSDDLRTALRALRTIEVKADSEPVVAAAFILMLDPQPPVEEIHENSGGGSTPSRSSSATRRRWGRSHCPYRSTTPPNSS